MSFEVVFTDEASVQAQQIQDWIAERSFEGAIAWQKALWLAVGKLRERGSACGIARLRSKSQAEREQHRSS